MATIHKLGVFRKRILQDYSIIRYMHVDPITAIFIILALIIGGAYFISKN
jgi:hypothetical protein